MTEALELFRQSLQQGGLEAALKYLNSRTPHRFTGIYRYDGEMLRNERLYDRADPEQFQGDDVSMQDAYCALVGQQGESLTFIDVNQDGRITVKSGSPVIAYCGVLIRDAAGQPFGSLCHFDIQPCQARLSDVPLLEAAAPLVYQALRQSQKV